MRRKSPCMRWMTASFASHSRAALSATASRTGWISVGELAITLKISLVAVCCSKASVRSRFLAPAHETAARSQSQSRPDRQRFREA